MKISKLTINDVEKYNNEILMMLQQSFEKSFPETKFELSSFQNRVESLKKYLREEKASILGSINGERLAGFVWFFKKDASNEEIIHINSFVVHEDFRQQGIGKALFAELEKHADKEGVKEIELFVTKNNVDAVRFYEKKEFEIERFVMKKRL